MTMGKAIDHMFLIGVKVIMHYMSNINQIVYMGSELEKVLALAGLAQTKMAP